MKYRYGYDEKKKLVRVAKVYSKNEHSIRLSLIDNHVISIIKKLKYNGYQGYVVGGALRDIILGKIPKDFDIATNAQPNKIKRVFRQSQIIGKRFRIVLVPVGKGSFIEVTTFRNNSEKDMSPFNTSIFGTMEQDVKRRDFTCNALYYCPIKEELIDFTNAMRHLRQKKLVPIRMQYTEDPVRMLRAIKFSIKCSLRLPLQIQLQVKMNAHLISQVSRSRMTEEVIKILLCGNSAEIMLSFFSFKLFKYMLPKMNTWIAESKVKKELFYESLLQYDAVPFEKKTRSGALAVFIKILVTEYVAMNEQEGKKVSIVRLLEEVKSWISPITPPNYELKQAIQSIIYPKNYLRLHSKNNQKRKRRYKKPPPLKL